MYCKECGSWNQEENGFCAYCGKPVNGTRINKNANENSRKIKEEQVVLKQNIDTNDNVDSVERAEEKNYVKMSKLNTIRYSGAMICAVVVGVVLIFTGSPLSGAIALISAGLFCPLLLNMVSPVLRIVFVTLAIVACCCAGLFYNGDTEGMPEFVGALSNRNKEDSDVSVSLEEEYIQEEVSETPGAVNKDSKEIDELFVGIWEDTTDGFCTIQITSVSDGKFLVEIVWEYENVSEEKWKYLGEYDFYENGILCQDTVLIEEWSNGRCISKEEIAKECMVFIGKDGSMYLDDQSEQAGRHMVFEKQTELQNAPSNETANDSWYIDYRKYQNTSGLVQVELFCDNDVMLRARFYCGETMTDWSFEIDKVRTGLYGELIYSFEGTTLTYYPDQQYFYFDTPDNLFQGEYYYNSSVSQSEAVSLLSVEDFILGSDSKYYSWHEIVHFDEKMCSYARNGVYALYGRKFDSVELQNYFSGFSWYVPRIEPEDFEQSMLNEYAKANVKLIIELEKENGFNGY